MRRLILLLLTPLVVIAAPVPKEKLSPEERLKKYWGTAVVPDDKCSAVADASGITLASEGGFRPELTETASRSGTGVRTEWPVSGDFEVTVRLVSTTETSHDAPRRGSDARIRSGLYVSGKSEYDVGSFVWVGRQLRADEEKGRRYFDNALWLQEASTGSHLGKTKPDEESWVRFTRKGDKWTCGWSADGRKWATWKVNADLGDVVTVGVFLTHDVDQKCEATFSGFSVSQPKADEKK